LNVIPIHVPSLTERVEDIPILADYFMGQFCQNNGKPPMFFDPEAFDYLKQIKWTGNIRELRNVVERLTILCDGKITGEDVKKYAMV